MPPENDPDIARLEARCGHAFARRELLATALTHASAGPDNNERLEFLGDALLDLAIAAELYARFPQLREGQLHRLRASLVRGETLAAIGRELGIGAALRLGAGEAASGGRDRDSNLADTVEALLGAVLLDAGVDAALATARAWFATRLERLEPGVSLKDPKTELQEFLQARRQPLPRYELLEPAPVAGGAFRVLCHVRGIDRPAPGEGRTRRIAEQQAAAAALGRLQAGGGQC
ncbi:MAG: Ribonuclease 3 [Pseudomonadales bacterium]|nr:Ribonuclease 3 [Pseudomonadales bacterium]